ncbi:lysyl oxidase family protein [Cupriavidus sp. WKF15]|uniref:lysyl oxidase family protein n=1 Tax=Cupriavidus sp. WKF15 TaxID=3032282 RepID=UPI0023E2FE6A|nr:lysyl oxidase family protein [Cupriavidus sp. WKF15]WER48605.1 lysyl oxidase family protein [Cupriavidus sp. WKF15]
MGVNLVPELRRFAVVDFDFPDAAHVPANQKSGTAGSILDGCVTPGMHRILKFDFMSKNIGDTDLVIGDPKNHPSWYEYSQAHGHFHLKDYNVYALYNAQGDEAAPGKKQGFCMVDIEPIQDFANPGQKKFTDCVSNQGITVGWADVYSRELACQFIVIDGVPDGDYTIVATTNASHVVPEDTYDDNTICVGVRLAGTGEQNIIDPPIYHALTTPTVNFNDVPAGETAVRPVEFEVRSCRAVSFSIVSGPTTLTGSAGTTFGTLSTPGSMLAEEHSLLPRNAFLWLTYKGTNAGDVGTGEVKVKCNETGEEWTVPIIANTIKRPTVAVVLALDQSGSMGWPAGTGANRIDVLHDAASRFVELAQANNGIGLVRFDDKAYFVDAVLPLTDPSIDINRPKLTADIKATMPHGATSIGNGLEQARTTIDPVTGYDNKAIVVFTDGLENTYKFIKDVKDLITNRTFAIGLGTAQQVSTSALTALTMGTGGYLLISGALSSAIDDYFRLSKYFLQILAAVTNNNVVKDPSGYISRGQKVRVPFRLNSSDIDATAILLTDLPIVDFALETPAGHVVGPTEALALGATVASGTNMLYYRFGLPLLGGGKPAHAGLWHAVLGIDDGERSTSISRIGKYTARYNVSVHAYSNVRLSANLTQGSFEPGATLALRATLTEFGIPLIRSAQVQAELRLPDGTQTTLSLTEVRPGVFETDMVASLAGVYQFHLVASGWTHRGEAFTREHLLTGVTVIGGNSPSPATPTDHRGDLLCCLLDCLLKNDALGRFLAEHHIDAAMLQQCARMCCEKNSATSKDELAKIEGAEGLQTSDILRRLGELVSQPEFAEALRKLVGGSGQS